MRFQPVNCNMMQLTNKQNKVQASYTLEAGGLAQWLALRTTDQGVPGSRPGGVAVRCGLEQVTFTPVLSAG